MLRSGCLDRVGFLDRSEGFALETHPLGGGDPKSVGPFFSPPDFGRSPTNKLASHEHDLWSDARIQEVDRRRNPHTRVSSQNHCYIGMFIW